MQRLFFKLMPCLLGVLCLLGMAWADEDLLTPDERAFLQSRPPITLSYSTDFPPMLVVDEDGNQSGVVPDVTALLRQKLNTPIQLVVGDWQTGLAAARNRQTDGLGLVTQTPDLTDSFSPSSPVFNTFLYLFVRSDEQYISSLADLEHRKVGYLSNMQDAKQLLKLQPVESVSLYPSMKRLMAALALHEIDAVIGNASIEYWRKQHGGPFKAATILPESKSDMAFQLRNDQPLLHRIINKGLAAITETEKQVILDKWFGRSISPWAKERHVLSLTREEREWLAAHPLIWVGFHPLGAPIEFLDEEEQPQGMSVEYLNRLESMLGVRFEFAVGRSWQDVQQQVAKGTLDMLPSIPETSQRKEVFNFTQPYLSIPIVIFSAVNSAYLGGIEAISNRNVIVLEDSAVQEWLERDHPELDLTTVENTKEALRLLTQDENSVFVGDLITTSYYIGQSGLLQVRVVGETPYTNGLSMAVRKDWELFPGILQKALQAIPQYERDIIYNDWISIKYRHSTDYSTIFQVIAIALLVLLFITYWNLTLAREVKKRRRIESELSKAKQAAEQANQSKSEFLANISHELRTPMHAVLGFTTLLQQYPVPTGKSAQYLQGIQAAGKSLLQLIDDILDLSKAEAGKLELMPMCMDIRRLIQEMESTFSYRVTDKNLILYYQVSDSVPQFLYLDEIRLRQILVNLIGNAIKFTDQGSITIKVDAYPIQEFVYRLEIAVADTGVGIPVDQQEMIFGVFNQRNNQDRARYKGTGLGLAISLRLATLMNGTIDVDSSPGKGSVFTLTLPEVPDASHCLDSISGSSAASHPG